MYIHIYVYNHNNLTIYIYIYTGILTLIVLLELGAQRGLLLYYNHYIRRLAVI